MKQQHFAKHCQFITFSLLSLVLQSCCGAYYTEYVDPLYLETRGKVEKCPFTPCPSDSSMKNCKIRPWFNVEYERNEINIIKIGATYHGYTPMFMMLIGANYLYSPSNINGINLVIQGGALPYNGVFTSFVGIDYGRWNKSVSSQIVSPHVGFTIPYSILRNTQFKFGYNIGIKNPLYNSSFAAINIKLPIFHLF